MKLLLTSLGIGAVPGFVEGATGRAPEGLHLGFIWDAAAAEAEDPEGQWQLDRLEALGFKAIRRLYPDYDLWRDFPYEYAFGKLAIDVINGSPLLREWVDDEATAPGDLDTLTQPDERAWEEARRPFLLY